MATLDKSMNRPRAEKIDTISDEMWNKVNPFNRKMAEEFLRESTHLSVQTLKQYPSALKIFFYWVFEECDDKKIIDIKSKDFLKYQNSLQRRGLSEKGVRFKRSVISSMNEYILLYYQDEHPTFRNFITKQIKVNKTGEVYKKEPVTPEEYITLCNSLEVAEEWQKLAYLKFTYSTGCRRAETLQLKKDIISAEQIIAKVKIKDENGIEQEVESKSYRTPLIRCKGKGELGVPRRLQFSQDAMNAIKKWIEFRGEDDCEFVFISKYRGSINQTSEATIGSWCKSFESVIGRRFHPHLLRESRATNVVVHEGKDIEVARKLLGHQSSETTKIYVIRESDDDANDAFID